MSPGASRRELILETGGGLAPFHASRGPLSVHRGGAGVRGVRNNLTSTRGSTHTIASKCRCIRILHLFAFAVLFLSPPPPTLSPCQPETRERAREKKRKIEVLRRGIFGVGSVPLLLSSTSRFSSSLHRGIEVYSKPSLQVRQITYIQPTIAQNKDHIHT